MTADKIKVAAEAVTGKTPAKAKRVVKPVAEAKSNKTATRPKPAVKESKHVDKAKRVRDSFSMPKTDYLKIAEIKEACLKAGMHVKKSEVLRAGLRALGAMNEAQLKRAIAGLKKE